MDEKRLVSAYLDAKVAMDQITAQVESHFYRAAQGCTDEKALRSLIDRCPDHVTKVFLMDMLRQMKLDAPKAK